MLLRAEQGSFRLWKFNASKGLSIVPSAFTRSLFFICSCALLVPMNWETKKDRKCESQGTVCVFTERITKTKPLESASRRLREVVVIKKQFLFLVHETGEEGHEWPERKQSKKGSESRTTTYIE